MFKYNIDLEAENRRLTAENAVLLAKLQAANTALAKVAQRIEKLAPKAGESPWRG